MVKLFIDDRPVEVKEGTTILRAAGEAGIPIPHFCYHPTFAPEGSCRMCLVEVEGLPKLELACSTVVREGMKVQTQSPRVRQARRAVLEFLLAEHPLDCPICDKAGECKLQDYFEAYGLFESQFKEAKEKRDKKVRIAKNLILDRERCILCTRCVRFLDQITATREAGVLFRGIHSEIGIYESEFIDNNYAGNLAELCPVGAITDTDFRFKTRTWFLDKGESICPLCSRGCRIVIDWWPGFPRIPRTRRVFRIRAQENPGVNDFWICDFGRYGYHYLDENRQERILLRKGGKETELTWESARLLVADKIRNLLLLKKRSRLAVVLNSWLTNEELFLADKLFRQGLGLEKVYVVDPPAGQGDGFLLTEERTPNLRGAREIGFSLDPLDLENLAASTDLLLLFGAYVESRYNLADIQKALSRIERKVLFSSHRSQLDGLVDLIIPTLLIAEKGGSLTNVEGKVQAFAPALPDGNGLPEWKVFLELARELKVDYKYYWQFDSPLTVRREMGKEIPFFK